MYEIRVEPIFKADYKRVAKAHPHIAGELRAALRNKEHNPPHVHAITQDFDAPFLIATGEIMEGEFPAKAKKMVKEFILAYRDELNEMWETERYAKLPPLE